MTRSGTGPAATPSAAPLPGTAFALTVPASWFELDLRPQTRDGAIRALVDARIRGQAELADHRQSVVKLLRGQARRAWEAGAVYCACMVEPTDEGPITAAVTVSIVEAPIGAGAAEDRLTPLLERLHAKQAAGPDDTWTRVEVVRIDGAGESARTAGVEDVDLPDGSGWVRTVLMQTFVPLPDGQRVALVTCSSPVLPLADVLLDLFDAVSSTLRLGTAAPDRPAP